MPPPPPPQTPRFEELENDGPSVGEWNDLPSEEFFRLVYRWVKAPIAPPARRPAAPRPAPGSLPHQPGLHLGVPLRTRRYYRAKGFWNMVVGKVLDFATVLVVAVLVLVVFAAFDFGQLQRRLDHGKSCPDYDKLHLFSVDCHGNHPIDLGRLGRLPWGVYLLLAVVFGAWGCLFAQFVPEVPKIRRMRRFFSEELLIDQRTLQTVSWEKVMEKLVQAQARLEMCKRRGRWVSAAGLPENLVVSRGPVRLTARPRGHSLTRSLCFARPCRPTPHRPSESWTRLTSPT